MKAKLEIDKCKRVVQLDNKKLQGRIRKKRKFILAREKGEAFS